MIENKLSVGDVVQLNPTYQEPFGGKLLIVSELKNFGCQGYIDCPSGRIYLRPKFDDFEFVGRVCWIFEYNDEEQKNA